MNASGVKTYSPGRRSGNTTAQDLLPSLGATFGKRASRHTRDRGCPPAGAVTMDLLASSTGAHCLVAGGRCRRPRLPLRHSVFASVRPSGSDALAGVRPAGGNRDRSSLVAGRAAGLLAHGPGDLPRRRQPSAARCNDRWWSRRGPALARIGHEVLRTVATDSGCADRGANAERAGATRHPARIAVVNTRVRLGHVAST